VQLSDLFRFDVDFVFQRQKRYPIILEPKQKQINKPRPGLRIALQYCAQFTVVVYVYNYTFIIKNVRTKIKDETIILFLLLLLPGEIPERRSVLGETQYVVHIVRLRHFDDEMEESNSRFVGSGVEQFRQRIQCKSARVASIASLQKNYFVNT